MTKKEIIEEIESYYTRNATCCFCIEDAVYAYRAITKAFKAGLLEGEKRMLDKAIECVRGEKDFMMDMKNGGATLYVNKIKVLNSLQALKNN